CGSEHSSTAIAIDTMLYFLNHVSEFGSLLSRQVRLEQRVCGKLTSPCEQHPNSRAAVGMPPKVRFNTRHKFLDRKRLLYLGEFDERGFGGAKEQSPRTRSIDRARGKATLDRAE